MLKNKKDLKFIKLAAIIMVFTVAQSCGENVNKPEKKEDSVAVLSLKEEAHTHDNSTHTHTSKRIITPNDAQQLWIFPERKDKLGSGGLLQIYMDPESHPDASSGFSKYELGVGGALPEHKHNKTEEIAYFLSGTGVVISYENDERKETIVKEGYVWYTAPGEWHSFQNTGKEPLKLVFATVPNAKHGLLDFFKKVGVKPETEPSNTLSAEEFAKLAADNDLILKPSKIE
ncbi:MULTISPECIES: cupin domain-containing protein [Zobellia]|uniref:cupin domain-containing protein n=1 Tax=Zobellia TaxID=112040 RepID=UPI001BFF7538|nr:MULTISPECIES: cupin domain-containing protein [Zobellia]MBT9189125.1 cupin domain-containing protein [Zobellia russellii]MBU2973765.1 cupin domain-containing protein [Zobellia sp. B3R18]